MSENLDTKKFKGVPWYLIPAIFTAVVLFASYMTSESNMQYRMIALAICGGGLAWLINICGYAIGLATVVPSYFIAWYLLSSPLLALGVFLYIPTGISFAMVSKRRMTRSAAVGVTSFTVSVVMLAFLAYGVYSSAGELSVAAIRSVYTDVFDSARELLINSSTISVAGNKVAYFNSETAEEIITFTIGIIPGAMSVLTSIAAFIAGWIYSLLLKLTAFDPPEPSEWKIAPSAVSAAFYCVAALVATVSYAVLPVLFYAAVNVLFILMPFFTASGFAGAFAPKIVNNVPRRKILKPAILFISLFSNPVIFLFVASFFGVADSIRRIIPKRKTTEE